MGIFSGEWRHSFSWKWEIGDRVCVETRRGLYAGRIVDRRRTIFIGCQYLVQINKVGDIWVYEEQLS